MNLEQLKQEKSTLLLAKVCIDIKLNSEFKKFGISQQYLKLAILKRENDEAIKKINNEIVKLITVHDCFIFGIPM
jgi:hypothetical protein